MKSRKGYEAMAIRSRGAEGNGMLGPEIAATVAFKPGHSVAAIVVPADCVMKRLRVVGGKAAPV